MELIRKQVRMNQMGKTVTDQFMIGGDYNVPDEKSDVGRVLSGEGSLRIEETRRVENYLRVTGKLNFKVLYVTDSGDPRPGALEGMIPFEEMVSILSGLLVSTFQLIMPVALSSSVFTFATHPPQFILVLN